MSIFRRGWVCVWLTSVLGPGCLAGEVQDRYASAVETYLPAPFLDPSQPYADPTRALGPPDGRTVAIGSGAMLILRFFRGIPDGRGSDLRVVEIGPDGATAWIAVSEDGAGFSEYAIPAEPGGVTDFDIGEVGLKVVNYVRIRGIGDEGLDPGFDLDAIEALH